MTDTQQLAALAQEYWAFRVSKFPLDASLAGDKRFDRVWDGATIADYERRARTCEDLLARARHIQSAELSKSDIDTYELLVGQLQLVVEGWHVRDHLVPKLVPFPFFDSPGQLIEKTSLVTYTDYDNLIARLEGFPAFIEQHLETLEVGMAEGYRLPSVLLPRVRGFLAAFLAPQGFAQQFRNRFARSRTLGPASEDLQARANAAIDEALVPALRSVEEWLDRHGDAFSRESISICDQPNGHEYYLFRVREQTSTDLQPDEIHAIGLADITALHEEVAVLLETVGFKGDGRAFSSMLSGSSEFVDSSAERLLERTRAIAKHIDGLLPPLFGRLPRITYGVQSFTLEQSRDLPPALAGTGPADRSMPGIYWLTAIPERCPRHLLIPLTLHEAWPGHLMQLALAQELDELPFFRRYHWNAYNAYVEGWGLYCESVGLDLGLYDDPYDRFGRYSFALWRAARLVVDTGIHWKGWGREEAIEFMVEKSFMPRETVEAEVDRYIGMPAQALAYKLGERSIRNLRTEAERRLGESFSLRDFHDRVLSLGPVSLNVLERNVRDWIDR